MFVFGYNSSYQMILSFPYLVVILTTLGTPKNIFCINNNIMNDNSKQNKTTRARTSLVVLYLRNYAAGMTEIAAQIIRPRFNHFSIPLSILSIPSIFWYGQIYEQSIEIQQPWLPWRKFLIDDIKKSIQGEPPRRLSRFSFAFA